MLLDDLIIPASHKENINIKLIKDHADVFFAVGLHTLEHNPMLDIPPPLMQARVSSVVVSSQVVLPLISPLRSFGNVPPQSSLSV